MELVPWVPPVEPSPEIPGGLSPRELVRRILSEGGPPSATLADVTLDDDDQRPLLLLFAEVAEAAPLQAVSLPIRPCPILRRIVVWTCPASPVSSDSFNF